MKKRKIAFLSIVGLMSMTSCQGGNMSNNSVSSKESVFSSETQTTSTNGDNSSSVSSVDTSSSTTPSSNVETSTSSQSSVSTSSEEKMTIDDCIGTERTDFYESLGYECLYADPNFRRGFTITKNSTTAEGGPYHSEPLKAYDNSSKPIWTMAQWGTKYDIYESGYTVEKSDDGLEYLYTSSGPTIDGEVVPAKRFGFNSKTGGIYMECNTEVEYDQPRTGREPWVHLLYSQGFDYNLINISSLSSLVMEATYTVDYFENNMGSAEKPNVHAAQLVWYITLQNRNKASANYGNYIWFGVGLWDNRSAGKVTNLYAAHDTGTSTFIYNPSSETYLTKNDGKIPNVGEKVTAKLDVMSVAKAAYDLAIERGYLGSTKFEDLSVGGTNFGYEVPGTYHIKSTIDAIGVYYKTK